MNTQAYHFINAAACLLPYCIPLPLVIQHKLAFCYFHFALFAAICAIRAVKLCCEVRACTSRSSHQTVKANSYTSRGVWLFYGFGATVFCFHLPMGMSIPPYGVVAFIFTAYYRCFVGQCTRPSRDDAGGVRRWLISARSLDALAVPINGVPRVESEAQSKTKNCFPIVIHCIFF